MTATFVMPMLGADMAAGTLAQWYRRPGDKVERGDIVAAVETDKGVIDVECFASGVIGSHLVAEGQEVPVGTPLATILGVGDEVSTIAPPPAPPLVTAPAPVAAATAPAPRAPAVAVAPAEPAAAEPAPASAAACTVTRRRWRCASRASTVSTSPGSRAQARTDARCCATSMKLSGTPERAPRPSRACAARRARVSSLRNSGIFTEPAATCTPTTCSPSPYREHTAYLPFLVEEYTDGDGPHYLVSKVADDLSHPTFVAGVGVDALERRADPPGDRDERRSQRRQQRCRALRAWSRLADDPPARAVGAARRGVGRRALHRRHRCRSRASRRLEGVGARRPRHAPDARRRGGGACRGRVRRRGRRGQRRQEGAVRSGRRTRRGTRSPRQRRSRRSATGFLETTLPSVLRAEHRRHAEWHVRLHPGVHVHGRRRRRLRRRVRATRRPAPDDGLDHRRAQQRRRSHLRRRAVAPDVDTTRHRAVAGAVRHHAAHARPGAPPLAVAARPDVRPVAVGGVDGSRGAHRIGVLDVALDHTGRRKPTPSGSATTARSCSSPTPAATRPPTCSPPASRTIGIGPVLGVHANTGAGGANVWTHELLRRLMDAAAPPDSPFAANPFSALPANMGLRVAVRRTVRVGDRSGTPVEDLGVVPDERHAMTRRDLLEGNADLIEHAGRLLAGLAPPAVGRQGRAAGSGGDGAAHDGRARSRRYMDSELRHCAAAMAPRKPAYSTETGYRTGGPPQPPATSPWTRAPPSTSRRSCSSTTATASRAPTSTSWWTRSPTGRARIRSSTSGSSTTTSSPSPLSTRCTT